MKTYHFLCSSLLFLFFSFSIFSQQQFKGLLIDSISRQAIEFANVGIEGKGIGTVSNEKGEFSFLIPDSLKNSVVKISLIGYRSKKVRAAEKFSDQRILLSPEAIALREVPVAAKKSVTKILGNETTSKSVSAGFKKNSLGCEFAIKLHVKHKQTHLKKLLFHINNNDMDSLLFRFNVYSVSKKGYPEENILKQNIIISTKVKTGLVSIDLLPYSIFTDEEVFIAIEWIKDLGDVAKLMFSTKMIGNATYFRQASQDKWEKVSPIGVGLHAEVSY
jgi:hypothetical protein